MGLLNLIPGVGQGKAILYGVGILVILGIIVGGYFYIANKDKKIEFLAANNAALVEQVGSLQEVNAGEVLKNKTLTEDNERLQSILKQKEQKTKELYRELQKAEKVIRQEPDAIMDARLPDSVLNVLRHDASSENDLQNGNRKTATAP